ncbi:hypothetical protein [Hydrogenophaga sp. BPS33]|uniref:hypothetical protein n=1 Tax=Hydrogenophaga sp. BPS33 TaxID=2651974 RepID=UPI00131FE50C|nr:hypothetical protein [Hydrogenophaga sp. BPS33]QHE84886.1 hypothetical protein F9K07_08300 [Hydrogenophaga sp. BPS33]
MHQDEIDTSELRVCLRLALDFITAHRIAHDGTYDVGKITTNRDTLEQRVLLALTETDFSAMPANWSWKQAAHEIAIRVALAMVENEKSRPQSS